MTSLLPDFKYDIFISYRQKDNKYDGWVTEFVDNLKRELDSMFKDEVSVYFDINPSDYLLENYDVDASLKDKLRCLVFIPIVSRTYCDPKAFAWEYEFRAFIDLASHDRIGMKVELPNGNFANRVLPVRIHDLDIADTKLIESAMGGVLRPIDFIYKESGVNRQLRARDDDIIKSPGQVLYRDQINKVALAIREIVHGIELQQTGITKGVDKEESGEEAGTRKSEKKQRAEAEKASPSDKEKTAGSLKADQEPSEEIKKSKPVFLTTKFIAAAIIVILIATGGGLLLNRLAKARWARDEVLKEARELYETGFYPESFTLAKKAEIFIPKDTVLQTLLAKVSAYHTILTDPPGADVYWKEYPDTSGNWIHIGQTPIDSLQVPAHAFYRFRIDKEGYYTKYGATFTRNDTLSRRLLKSGESPEGMIWVDGYLDEAKNPWVWEKELGFFLDKYEVTNKKYKEFIDHGGYRIRDYWKHNFINEGEDLSWEEAMVKFVDQTGRPGPSTWVAGDYPDGQDDYPVSGVSWYEAAAYAEYAGKVLPTGEHWDSGVGYQFWQLFDQAGPVMIAMSNFNSRGPLPAGQMQGISDYGAYDMAGNVREWCFNETTYGRIIAGGGYDSPPYMFSQWDQLPTFNRSPLNGFRCAKYTEPDRIPETAFRSIDMAIRNVRDCAAETPVDENTFNIFRNQFLYDKKDLDAGVEMRDTTSNDWIMEKVSFNAAYDNQRMIAYIFLPRNASPPFQTLIFFPGSYAASAKDFMTDGGPPNVYGYFDYVLKSGRAAVYPIYFRTYERNDGTTSHGAAKSHEYTDLLIKLVKDFSRTIDYLETRDDIDLSKLGYYGHSWGGRLGAIIPAVEDRLSLNILVAGGFPGTRPFPEADEMNYVPRVRIPTLMLNGHYDAIFPLETNVRPFFNLLGTPEADKRLYITEAGHNFYKKDRVGEILNWCDKYFGPPNYLHKE